MLPKAISFLKPPTPSPRARQRRFSGRCAATLLAEKVLPMPQRPRVDAQLSSELLRAQPAVTPALDSPLPLSPDWFQTFISRLQVSEITPCLILRQIGAFG
jgi:hypothetical protein